MGDLGGPWGRGIRPSPPFDDATTPATTALPTAATTNVSTYEPPSTSSGHRPPGLQEPPQHLPTDLQLATASWPSRRCSDRQESSASYDVISDLIIYFVPKTLD